MEKSFKLISPTMATLMSAIYTLQKWTKMALVILKMKKADHLISNLIFKSQSLIFNSKLDSE